MNFLGVSGLAAIVNQEYPCNQDKQSGLRNPKMSRQDHDLNLPYRESSFLTFSLTEIWEYYRC